MKSIYLHCPLLRSEDYCNVLDKLCADSVANVTVYIHTDRITVKGVKALVAVQESFGLERSVRFRNILVLPQLPFFSYSLRRILTKHSFSIYWQTTPEQAVKAAPRLRWLSKKGLMINLWSEETADQRAVYYRFSKHGFSVNFQQPCYTAETADWFSQWLYDPSAQGVNTFCDIMTMLTMDTHSPNCRYASCFSTTFRVDQQLQVYLCPWHMNERTLLGPLNTLDTLLQCDNVVQLLTAAVEKRKHCADNCHGFTVCQGGCLLEEKTGDECVHYIATVDRIREALLDVYHNNKLRQVNPFVKNAILNALAFNTAFF